MNKFLIEVRIDADARFEVESEKSLEEIRKEIENGFEGFHLDSSTYSLLENNIGWLQVRNIETIN